MFLGYWRPSEGKTGRLPVGVSAFSGRTVSLGVRCAILIHQLLEAWYRVAYTAAIVAGEYDDNLGPSIPTLPCMLGPYAEEGENGQAGEDEAPEGIRRPHHEANDDPIVPRGRWSSSPK